jgi:hypothetical protein
MAVEDPGELQVTCDDCGEDTMMDTTQYAGGIPSWGVDDSTIEANGWLLVETETFCPKCRADHEGE